MEAVTLNSNLVKMSLCQMIEISLIPIHDIYTRNSLIMLLPSTLQKHEAVPSYTTFFSSDSFSPLTKVVILSLNSINLIFFKILSKCMDYA